MKKEDLCMLLLVVALLLIVSRSTNIFEGVDETLGAPDIADIFGVDEGQDIDLINEVVIDVPPEKVASLPPTPKVAPLPPTPKVAPLPPTPKVTPPPPAPKATPPPPAPKPTPPPPAPKATPPPPAPKATPPPPAPKATPPPPAPKATPPPPAPKATPPPPAPKATPPPPAAAAATKPTEVGAFGSPLVEQKGAFGQGWINAWDSDTDVYASTGKDDEYGEKIPISMQQEYLTMKSLGTLTPQIMQNLGEQRSQGAVLGTDFKPWDPSSTSGALLDTQFKGIQGVEAPTQKSVSFETTGHPVEEPSGVPSGGAPIEVHMVYGDWCGHSKRAKPAFQELVADTSVTTGAGSPVKFVMTTDESPGMEQFKSSVSGFPSYMVVKGDGSIEKLNGHDRSKESIKDAVRALNY
tara:strand:- start:1627 stop:2850 length:1224 start_codon:yes stop_codon:yes gene_type:complete